MEKRLGRIACLLIALLLSLSGMCQENPKADSFFACIDHDPYTSSLSAPESVLSQYKLSSRETTGVRDTAYVSEVLGKPVVRSVFRIPLLYFFAAFFMLENSDLQRAVETVHAPVTRFVTVLLRLIHRKDGKK